MLISSEYSFWWLIPILFIAAALTFFLYRKDKYLKDSPIALIWTLSTIRFISLVFLGFFLIKPLINNSKKTIFKPQLLILHDNTQSVVLNKDSLFYKNGWEQQQEKFKQLLNENEIEFVQYGFSDSIVQNSQLTFDKKITNISTCLNEALDLNIETNIGGILLLSDGIYNKGQNPFYLSKNIQTPVYTVGLGDTTEISDLKINQININKIGFTNKKIPFSIDISAQNISDGKTQLLITEDEKELFSQAININKNNYFETIENILNQLSAGFHTLDFELSETGNETNIKNNKQRVYINIIDSKQKISVLYAAPHPDIAALKYVLEKNESLELTFHNIRDFKENVNDYNLFILHQIPHARNPAEQILKEIAEKNIPVLSIISPQTDLKKLELLDANIRFTRTLNKNEYIETSINPDFSLFKVSEELAVFLSQAPPIIAPMMKISNMGNNSTFAYQNIKNITTQNPAIVFTQNDNNKFGFIVGEGLWKWKIFNYQKENNFEYFSSLVNSMVNYLSIKMPKDAFIVDIKNQFEEYENVSLSVQLYNHALELVTQSEVIITYTNQDGLEHSQIFNSDISGYSTQLGILKPGKYDYQISTTFNNKEISKKGSFIVNPSILEYKNLKANHELLQSISENTNGNFFNRADWFNVVDSLKNHPKFKTKVYSSDQLSELINYKWIMFIIVLLLSIEWFIRKYSGSM